MNKFLTLVVALALLACQSKPESTMSEAVAPPEMAALKAPAPDQSEPEADELPPAPPPPPPPDRATSATINRKIIRNAQVRIRVSDFKASGLVIEKAVQQAGGQISSSNELKTNSAIENVLVIRVPAARFDLLLASLLKESIFTDTKSITSDDVTRRYVDTEARIRSKKATEETYLKLLKQARSVEDVLKVEEQLAEIREEREVQEAELRQLKDEITLSTINLTYYQQTEAALNPEEPFYAQIWHNLADGFRFMGDVVVGAFYFLPIGLVIAAVVWLVQRWRKKRKALTK